MPQLIAVFVTTVWLGFAVTGIVEWYWALLGWFASGPVYVGVKRLLTRGGGPSA